MNIRDGDEATPLHFAASRGHTETVILLISNQDSEKFNSSWTSLILVGFPGEMVAEKRRQDNA